MSLWSMKKRESYKTIAGETETTSFDHWKNPTSAMIYVIMHLYSYVYLYKICMQ